MILTHELGDGPLQIGSTAHRHAWLPRLGPTAYVLALELAGRATAELDDLGARLGVHPRKAAAALERLQCFRHVERIGDSPTGEPVYALVLTVDHPRPRKVRA